jgi:hypothetical protein
VPLLTGFGGVDGYGTPDHCVAAGNDNSYAAPGSATPTAIELAPAFPQGIRYAGQTFTRFYLNTNGNLTFADALATPGPTAFPVADQPMIAAWWADVDTRGGGSICFHLEPGLLVVTWHDVGSFDGHYDRRNDFQLALSVRPTCDYPGEINLYFRYHRCEWASGDGSDPAQVGFDAGNRMNFVALPMSRSPAIVDVCRTSNVPGGAPGLYRFDLGRRIFPACSEGQPCSVPGQRGSCAMGLTRCEGDTPICAQRLFPEAPFCDGIDHDCDGFIDEGDGLCPADEVCFRGSCRTSCGPGRACPAGSVCTQGLCFETLCAQVDCPSGQRCVGGRCAGLCESVTCARGERCSLGRCVALCAESTCDPPEFCDDDPASPTAGACIRRCECAPCSDGRACRPDGRCVPPAPPPVDAGTAADAVVAPDAAPQGRLVDAGCGCRAGARPSRWPLSLLALALMGRRRRSRQTAPAPRPS